MEVDAVRRSGAADNLEALDLRAGCVGHLDPLGPTRAGNAPLGDPDIVTVRRNRRPPWPARREIEAEGRSAGHGIGQEQQIVNGHFTVDLRHLDVQAAGRAAPPVQGRHTASGAHDGDALVDRDVDRVLEGIEPR